MKKKKKVFLTALAAAFCIIAAATVIKIIPAEYEPLIVPVSDKASGAKSGSNEDLSVTQSTHTYDRLKVRKYAEFACIDPDNGLFRYLDTSNGDSATDCANFVSQCIYAGGYHMTDKWYMKKYSDNVPKVRRILDKVTGKSVMLWHEITGSSDDYGEYTEMSYLWTYPWTCAGVQAEYGETYFYSDHFTVSDYSTLKKTVLENDIKTGDVIYQGMDKHHVVIISDARDDGTLYISSHNPVLFDKQLDEEFWERGGFSGGCEIYKVKDEIE